MHNIKSAKRMVEKARPEVWDVLEEVIKEHPVLLNRAPTLHRLGIQAFEPVLVEGRAIQLHPLVCPAYNADFDGDQMAVHVPLSTEAQAEARILMLSSHNILSPAHGRPLATPNQDVIVGCYYLTIIREGARGEGKTYSTPQEAILAYNNDYLDLQAKIKVRTAKGMVETSVGRLIFKENINVAEDFIDGLFAKIGDRGTTRKDLNLIVSEICRRYGTHRTAELLDQLKRLGYRFATQSGTTISISDIQTPPEKKEIIAATEQLGDQIELQYRRGLITSEERYQRFIDIWAKAKDDVTAAMVKNHDHFNPVSMMSNSGARGNAPSSPS